MYDYLTGQLDHKFKDQFPNGFIQTQVRRCLSGNGWTIAVRIGLIRELSDVAYSIRHNDPMYHTFMITDNGHGLFEATSSIGSLMVNATVPHMAMSSVKTGFRKTTGDADKIVAGFDRFFKKLRKVFDDNKEDVYHVENIPVKYL